MIKTVFSSLSSLSSIQLNVNLFAIPFYTTSQIIGLVILLLYIAYIYFRVKNVR